MGYFLGFVFVLVVSISTFQKITADKDDNVTKQEKRISWVFWAWIMVFVVSISIYFFL
ncbi:hypothetical protein [Lacticigenium naphthae]|uniref:hypothetical protein n=1 Tax=Lacticigenium naphthae TaxID=515351 RepID=UPI0004079811|nr:hypothetical protein [Lacticigenium naphthae]